MFELNQYEKRLHQSSPSIPEQPYSPADNIAEMSMMVWGEHCVECAAPACYQTCDLYRSRPDGRCRRFQFGIHKNEAFKSVRGYGAEISFSKWGVLVARGNVRLQPVARIKRIEQILEAFSHVINPVGSLIASLTGDRRWKHAMHSLMLKAAGWTSTNGSAPADTFLLETYNPENAPIRLHFTIERSPDNSRSKLTNIHAARQRFSTTITLSSGYARYEFDGPVFKPFVDAGAPFDISLTPEADSSATLVILSADFVRYKSAVNSRSAKPAIKCVVWDLDNTLWKGTLVENVDVQVDAKMAQLIRELDGRGILVSIASKNDFESAWARVCAFGLQEYFLYPHISWQPKSQSITMIAQKLNIGLDTLAFIDDNPFERHEVTAALPQVTSIDTRDAGRILDDPRFKGSSSAEASQRRHYYRQSIVREEKQAEFGADYRKFLAYCEIKLHVLDCRPEYLDRVAELAQRTNQLNFSGHKYTREEIGQIVADPRVEKYVLQCSDRFGEYGIVGLVLVRRGTHLCVEEFMLSCRVQGKFIEAAFFNYICGTHVPITTTLRVRYNRTDRNGPAFEVLRTLGSVHDVKSGFSTLEARSLVAMCDFIDVRSSATNFL
jgi:FkbH-like protein